MDVTFAMDTLTEGAELQRSRLKIEINKLRTAEKFNDARKSLKFVCEKKFLVVQ